MCAELGVAPSEFRGRRRVTTYEYDAEGRLVATYMASPWTAEDRALMLARLKYQRTLCSGCGEPKATAWHPDNDGWFDVEQVFTCHSCTALAAHRSPEGKADPVEYPVVVDTRDYTAKPLPPWPAAGAPTTAPAPAQPAPTAQPERPAEAPLA